MPLYITAANVVIFILLCLVSVLQKKLSVLNRVVCPFLTVLIFLYLSFLDYDFTIGSIYYS